ncbi:MAG: MFS transporter [bacterium]|nr:MFS transporter [bacterium]
MSQSIDGSSKNLLEKTLSVFAPVHGGEGRNVLLLAVNVFFLLTAYYIIKPVREALILSEFGAETKIYAAAGQALLLLLVVPVYSRLAGKVNRRRLITIVTLFFIGCLVGFYFLAQTEVSLGIAFYLWVGIFNVMVIAQFWSFANDIYTPEQGKRLFAIVGFGSSSGAVFGSFVTGMLIEPLGVYQLLLLSGGLLAVSLALTLVVDGSGQKTGEQTSKNTSSSTSVSGNGFALVFKSKYLLLIALMMVLANLVNTTGEYILGSRVKANAQASVPAVVLSDEMTRNMTEIQIQEATAEAESARRAEIGVETGKFYSQFFTVVNWIGLLTQLFLVSRIVRWSGVHWAIMILPMVALGGYFLMAVIPALAVVRWAKSAENATDYSLQNTVRNMLFLPTSREEKYQAKQAIDSFFVRAGDMLAGLLVLVGTTVWHLSVSGFAWVTVGMAAIWLYVAWAIGRRYRKLV